MIVYGPMPVGSIKETLERWPQLTNVLPAMGYGDELLQELEEGRVGPQLAAPFSDPDFPAPYLRALADAEPSLRDDSQAVKEEIDTLVVTSAVPCERLDELVLSVLDHRVSVTGPQGFEHELELPEEADMSALTIELFKGFLELRAPRRSRVAGGA